MRKMDLFSVSVSSLGYDKEAMVLAETKASAVTAFLEEIDPGHEDLHEILISQAEGQCVKFKLPNNDEVMDLDIDMFISIFSFFATEPIIFSLDVCPRGGTGFWKAMKGLKR